MKRTIESAILEPIKQELIGHDAKFYTEHTKFLIAKNIKDIFLDSLSSRFILVSADKITFQILGYSNISEREMYRIPISAQFEIIK